MLITMGNADNRVQAVCWRHFRYAFSGKYETCFLLNQGSREERLELSSMQFGLWCEHFEREAMENSIFSATLLKVMNSMALLVQRVSGGVHDPCLPLCGVDTRSFLMHEPQNQSFFWNAALCVVWEVACCG
jgi:hypothetical protein